MAEPEKSIAHWQLKYRSLVREQAANEERYQKQVDLLRHTVVRVGTVAQGTDTHLDNLLHALKKELRNKDITRGFLQVIRDIEQSVGAVEQIKSDQSRQWSAALAQILDLLAGRMTTPQKPALEKFRAQIDEEVSGAQLSEVLAELHALLATFFAEPAAPIESPVEAPEQQTAQPFSVVSDAIAAVLQELIEHIKPPAAAIESVKRIQRAIQQGLNWYELVPTLEELSLLVLASLYDSQQKFERYLKQLFEQLAQLHLNIDAAARDNDSALGVKQRIGDTVSEEIGRLNQQVQESADVDTLKAAVAQGLEVISGRLGKFAGADAEAHSALQQQLQSLTAQVTSLQEEAKTARKLLQQQKQKALIDPLTQLPNRQAYNERSVLEFKRWQRYQRPLSLVVGDIDLFKNVNDTFGHLAGDKVLSVVAQLLRHRLRQTDFIARFGGEEVVFLLPETTRDQALETMESVREQISQCGFHFAEQPVKVTMSFGVTELIEGDGLETAFARADQALYQAKNGGRNQCVPL